MNSASCLYLTLGFGDCVSNNRGMLGPRSRSASNSWMHLWAFQPYLRLPLVIAGLQQHIASASCITRQRPVVNILIFCWWLLVYCIIMFAAAAAAAEIIIWYAVLCERPVFRCPFRHEEYCTSNISDCCDDNYCLTAELCCSMDL